MYTKPERLALAPLLKKLAPKIGARVLIESEWKIAGQIHFKNGSKRYFRYNTLDLNRVGASDIAKDKDYANFFMRHMGYQTIEGRAFLSSEFAKAIGSTRTIRAASAYAKTLGFPVVVKPNSGSQGNGVAVVENEKELLRALRAIFKKDRVALVQRRVTGRDYRIVVLDKKVISAYERIPLNVVGDGRSTIRQLMLRKQKEFVTTKRDTKINFGDPRIALKLRRQKLSFNSTPKKGDTVLLLDNANLSSGGDSMDVTNLIHPEIKKMAVKLTHDMGLRLCGVDIMVADATKKPSQLRILEINAAPGLDHYVKSGRKQEKIVEALYLEVLKRMEK